MSEQELERRMKEIIDQYSPILDAKPIEDLRKEIKSGIPSLKVVTESPDNVDDVKDTKNQTNNKEYQHSTKVKREEKKYI